MIHGYEIEPTEHSARAEALAVPSMRRLDAIDPQAIERIIPKLLATGSPWAAPLWINACNCTDDGYHVECHSLQCRNSDREVVLRRI